VMLEIAFWNILLAGAVRLATPVLLAALGETIVERGGMINLGIEGIMTLGAFTGVFGASAAGWGAGLALGAAVGAAIGLIMAVTVLRWGADQVVTGIAITLIGYGLADYFFEVWQPTGRSAVIVPLAPTITIPGLGRLPLIGQALFQQSVITYAAVVAVLMVYLALKRSRAGLILRAAGDDPDAVALRGVSVVATRTWSLMLGGLLAGLGGAAITVGYLGSYTDDVVSGRGYIAIAVVIIGRWSPLGAMGGALLFALFDSLALQAQSVSTGLPVEFYSALPYVVTLVTLVATARAASAPRSLGRPYEA
jgi:general nucleoside transport system permease protein